MSASTVEVRKRRRRWRTQLRKLRREVVDVLRCRQIYDRLREIVEANPAIQRPWTFHNWLIRNYTIATLVRVRRLVDQDGRTWSLVRLLEEIKRDPDLVSYRSHRAFYRKHYDRRDGTWLARSAFKSVAGQGGGALPRSVVEADLKKLRAGWQRLEVFTNKRVAHLDRQVPRGPAPKIREVNAAIDLVSETLRRYELLLLGSATGKGQEPVAQDDWDTVLTRAWIPRTRRAQ